MTQAKITRRTSIVREIDVDAQRGIGRIRVEFPSSDKPGPIEVGVMWRDPCEPYLLHTNIPYEAKQYLPPGVSRQNIHSDVNHILKVEGDHYFRPLDGKVRKEQRNAGKKKEGERLENTES